MKNTGQYALAFGAAFTVGFVAMLAFNLLTAKKKKDE